MNEQRIINGLTWEKQDRDFKKAGATEPLWVLIWPGKTHFVLKNYGERDSAFSGTKLVSGGPFDAAGKYKSVDEAMHSPQLATYLKEQLEMKATEAAKELRACAAAVQQIDKALKENDA